VLKKSSLGFIGFLQATGIFVYCLLIGSIMTNGNQWFGPSPNLLGPTLFLLLFIFSAVFTCLLYLGYPFYLFWEKKQTKSALKLIIYTTIWNFASLALILTYFALTH
jgi:hypothetical protein